MGAAPFVDTFEQFLVLVFAWTAAGTALSAGPTSYIADIVESTERSQALALLRTVGDVGMVTGAVVSGAVAGQLGEQSAMQLNGLVLLGLTSFAGLRLGSTLMNFHGNK